MREATRIGAQGNVVVTFAAAGYGQLLSLMLLDLEVSRLQRELGRGVVGPILRLPTLLFEVDYFSAEQTLTHVARNASASRATSPSGLLAPKPCHTRAPSPNPARQRSGR
ncbi:hypothetical protein [Streptomyces mirabilis]